MLNIFVPHDIWAKYTTKVDALQGEAIKSMLEQNFKRERQNKEVQSSNDNFRLLQEAPTSYRIMMGYVADIFI